MFNHAAQTISSPAWGAGVSWTAYRWGSPSSRSTFRRTSALYGLVRDWPVWRSPVYPGFHSSIPRRGDNGLSSVTCSMPYPRIFILLAPPPEDARILPLGFNLPVTLRHVRIIQGGLRRPTTATAYGRERCRFRL